MCQKAQQTFFVRYTKKNRIWRIRRSRRVNSSRENYSYPLYNTWCTVAKSNRLIRCPIIRCSVNVLSLTDWLTDLCENSCDKKSVRSILRLKLVSDSLSDSLIGVYSLQRFADWIPSGRITVRNDYQAECLPRNQSNKSVDWMKLTWTKCCKFHLNLSYLTRYLFVVK